MKLYNKFVIFLSIKEVDLCTKLIFILTAMEKAQVKFIKGYKHPLMELRPQPERIFYASWNKNRYILLHHYSKKKNRTDPREVHIAINRLDDWLQRH